MSHQTNKKSSKPVNPEARLQKSLARDISIRLLHEDAKHQADCLAIARWDNALAVKDVTASRRREKEVMIQDRVLTNQAVKAIRRVKLEELYAADESTYGQELLMHQLAYRRQRL